MSRARSAVDEINGLSEDQLYTELGSRLGSIARAPDGSDQFNMNSGQALEGYAPLDELKKLGQKFFARWNREAFNLVCGASNDDARARQQVAQAFGLGPEAVAATIAAVLTAHVGLAAALSTVVAMLAVRLFFKPGHQAMCDYWKEKLA